MLMLGAMDFRRRLTRCAYGIAELLVGAATGIVVIAVHHLFVPQVFGAFVQFVLSMTLGMMAQMVLSTLAGALVGTFEAMVPGMLTGMLVMGFPYFKFPSLGSELLVAAALGAGTHLAFAVWDIRSQGANLPVPRAPVSGFMPHPPLHWGRFARFYDLVEGGGSRRRSPDQRSLFSKMDGKVLFVAAGTGLNFAQFPLGKDIVAIDLTFSMLRQARARASSYSGLLILAQADAQSLPFGDASFQTVVTASTLCSVSEPVRALKEFLRVLQPGGTLLMFEHVRSHNAIVGIELDFMTWLFRGMAPAMNRDTVGNAQHAGFVIDRVVSVYLDVILAIEAHKPTP
jgi:ubiquinone/menaquinone biosynthesis C-methylase UbiE